MPARLHRDERYSSIAIAFHWTIALLVIVNLIVGIGKEWVPTMRAWMPGHKSIGLTVLVLTLARVVWRLAHRPPPWPPSVARWDRWVALATHWALYTLLVLMPLSGWMMVSGPEGRRPLDWFGLFPIPYLPIGEAAAGAGHGAHGLLGWLMVVLVAAHVAGALRHHLLLRDGILARMVPGVAR